MLQFLHRVTVQIDHSGVMEVVSECVYPCRLVSRANSHPPILDVLPNHPVQYT